MSSPSPAAGAGPIFDDIRNADSAGDDTSDASGLLTIDLAAIRANWRRLNALSGAAETGAVVKADAYGLGLNRIAPALWAAGARRFYVAQSGEGQRLRALLPLATIIVLAPIIPAAFTRCRTHNLIPTLNGPDTLAAWLAEAANAGAPPLPANLHIDTGMTRLGFDDEAFPGVFAALSPSARAAIVEVSSHLACADEPEHPANRAQLDRFKRAIATVPPGIRRSFANSSGIFLGPEFLEFSARPGMALYGLNPTPHAENPMQPVVSLDVRILQHRQLSRAESIGYGATARANAGARIATIAAGYADGLHRSIGNGGRVWINGTPAPLLGRVSMDLIAVDVGHMLEKHVVAGGWAEVIGPHQSADELAASAGSIGYEILTSFGQRYRRRYINAESDLSPEPRL